MAHSKDYKDGYAAAIEALKKAMQGQQSGQSSGGGQSLPNDMTSPVDVLGDQAMDKSTGSTGQNGQQKSQKPGQGSGSGSSRTSSKDENQGVVRPEDCQGSLSNNFKDIPGTAGGMIDPTTGDKLAEQEGYENVGGSESAIERDWAEAALKETEKFKGNLPGSFVSKIQGMYKTSTDWKKTFRNIVGHSLSPEDKRQAYANKNVLISQDRIARTDKDKYDNMDYMMAWVDSSGSMTDEQLKMCLSELYSLALAKKPMRLVLVQCDTKIHEIKEWTSMSAFKKDIVKQSVKGRGGTDLKPCWELLKNGCNVKEWKKYTRINPELIIIFTDGGLDQYKRDPRKMPNLCWAILDNPSWDVQYKDRNTKCVHLKTADIK